MENFSLTKKIFISGRIATLTGLHIGGANDEMNIGGMQNTIIKNPITNLPYIPGSSLKGKIRSLLEISHGTIGYEKKQKIKNPPTNNPNYLAAKLFGYTQYKPEDDNDLNNPQQASRVIVRDCFLINQDDLGSHVTEVKYETVIDRITSEANPRPIERVPPGAIFSMEIIVNIFSTDNESELIKGILEGLELLTDDYLGGSGSRGSGHVAISIVNITEKDVAYYKGDANTIKSRTVDFNKNYPNLFLPIEEKLKLYAF